MQKARVLMIAIVIAVMLSVGALAPALMEQVSVPNSSNLICQGDPGPGGGGGSGGGG